MWCLSQESIETPAEYDPWRCASDFQRLGPGSKLPKVAGQVDTKLASEMSVL